LCGKERRPLPAKPEERICPSSKLKEIPLRSIRRREEGSGGGLSDIGMGERRLKISAALKKKIHLFHTSTRKEGKASPLSTRKNRGGPQKGAVKEKEIRLRKSALSAAGTEERGSLRRRARGVHFQEKKSYGEEKYEALTTWG